MSFESFDSFEEAVQAMRRAEARANAAAHDEQVRITYGDYWMSAYDAEFLIFGRVSTLAELDAEEKRLGAGVMERRVEQEMIEGAHARGYRFGKAFSIVEPDGEIGSTHCSVMVPITGEMFARAESHRWDGRIILVCPDCRHWITQALTQARDWAI